LAETDPPAYEILAGILRVVPASLWSVACVQPSGALGSYYESDDVSGGLSGLTEEFNRQRLRVPRGPIIAATLDPPEDVASSVTLVFADARASYGILTLSRSAEEGSFTSTEIRVLTLALEQVSDPLSELRSPRVAPPSDRPGAPGVEGRDADSETDAAFYVLDEDLRIVLGSNPARVSLTGLNAGIAERLPRLLEDTVRELTSGWSSGAERTVGVRRPVPFLVVQTQPMSGPAGFFVGVHIYRSPTSYALSGAARYRISPREVQVLALLCDGHSLDQIAKQLNISRSTVQDHIKSMLDKTESRNRSKLIGRVLGWESSTLGGELG
jgi:DNA-binding CsgD family transcriptional regulator